jgi:hypothetical protein
VQRVLDDDRHRQAAQVFAARYQGFSQQHMNAELAALLEQKLDWCMQPCDATAAN